MAQQDVVDESWHWRNTMRPVRFFTLDARASIPFLILLVYARLITLILTVVVVGVFWFVEKRGLTFASALRSVRRWFVGDRRYGWLPYRRRKLRDYG